MKRLLENDKILLRALELEDIDVLYSIENDTSSWGVATNVISPYSNYVLKHYILNADKDLFKADELKLAIVNKELNNIVGVVDLFNIDRYNQKIEIGICVLDNHQKKGYAYESITLIKEYLLEFLGFKQIYCFVPSFNTASIGLFEKSGFKKSGICKNWVKQAGSYHDAIIYQFVL